MSTVGLCALATVLPTRVTLMRVANAASIMIYLADKFGNEELLPKVW
jgi:glutathione S-transferase